jgi:hypothetical protein
MLKEISISLKLSTSTTSFLRQQAYEFQCEATSSLKERMVAKKLVRIEKKYGSRHLSIKILNTKVLQYALYMEI